MCGISWPDMSDVFIDCFLLPEWLCALGVKGQPQVSPVLRPIGLIWGVRIGEALAFWSTAPHWLSSEGAISPLSALWGYFRSAHLAGWQPHIPCSVYNDSRVLLSHLSENSSQRTAYFKGKTAMNEMGERNINSGNPWTPYYWPKRTMWCFREGKQASCPQWGMSSMLWPVVNTADRCLPCRHLFTCCLIEECGDTPISNLIFAFIPKPLSFA